MVIVAQLVRAPDCGSGGRGFETLLSPSPFGPDVFRAIFVYYHDDCLKKLFNQLKINLMSKNRFTKRIYRTIFANLKLNFQI
jgi:hypothetical protein